MILWIEGARKSCSMLGFEGIYCLNKISLDFVSVASLPVEPFQFCGV